MSDDYKLDLSLKTPHDSREHQLWCSVLSLLIDDAVRYASGLKPSIPGGMEDGEQAFNAITECNETLRYICSFLDYDADVISERFCQNLGIFLQTETANGYITKRS